MDNGRRNRSRPTSPSADSIASHHHLLGTSPGNGVPVAAGKLEELHIGYGSGANMLSADTKKDSKTSHLPPLPGFSSSHKASDLNVEVAPANATRKSRRSFHDGDDLECSSNLIAIHQSPDKIGPLGPLHSPGEKTSPSDVKSSNGSAKSILSPDQRRASLTQPLPHIDKDSSPSGPISRRSKTPETMDPLLAIPSQRHAPALEHLESKEISAGPPLATQSRRSKTPEPDLMSLPCQRHAPALAHLENDSFSGSNLTAYRRSRTPEVSDPLVAPTSVPRTVALEHLEYSSHHQDRDPIRKLDNLGGDHTIHLHDHISELKTKKLSDESKDHK